MTRYSPLGLVAALLAATACSDGMATADRPLTATELAAPATGTMLDVVRQQRPAWLRSGHQPVVHIETPCPYTCLRWVEADLVQDVRYLNPRAAAALTGRRYRNGVVLVTLRWRSDQLR